MIYNYHGIMHPRLALSDAIDDLMPYYIEDYGVEYKELITDRIQNAVAIFDSNPKDVYHFILEHQFKISDREFIKRSIREYKNYIQVEKLVNAKMEKVFQKYLFQYFGMNLMNSDYSCFDLMFSAYGSESLEKYNQGSIEEREKIEKKRLEYRYQCLEAGVPAITSSQSIDEILAFRNIVLNKKNEIMVKTTKWGRRIKKEVRKNYHFEIPDNSLVDFLFDKGQSASTGVVKDHKGNARTVMYLPIIYNLKFGEADRVLFHELRHVVETSNYASGLYMFKDNKYDFINEIHTEKNALQDRERMHSKIFFARNEKKRTGYYERLFPYLGTFFEDEKKNLNWLALRNLVYLFEVAYGIPFLQELEYNLHHVDEFKRGSDYQYMKK